MCLRINCRIYSNCEHRMLYCRTWLLQKYNMLFLSTQMDVGAISESNKLFVLVMTQETCYHAQPLMIKVLF